MRRFLLLIRDLFEVHCSATQARRTALELARELEREGICEHCHKSHATELFDREFVCSPCRRELEQKLVKDG